MIVQPLWAFIVCMVLALLGASFIGVVLYNLFGNRIGRK